MCGRLGQKPMYGSCLLLCGDCGGGDGGGGEDRTGGGGLPKISSRTDLKHTS